MSTPRKVLIADDDASIRLVLSQAFTRAGFQVRATGAAATLMKWVSDGEGDLVITDVIMADENVFDVLPRMRKQRPKLPIIVMSAQNTLLTAVNAAETGAFEYMPKPFDLDDMVAAAKRALARPSQPEPARAHALAARDERLPLIGRSAPMQEVYRTLARLVGAELTVLILGMVLLFTSRTRSSSGHRWVTKVLARLPAIFTPRRLRSQWIGRFADYTADALETGATMPAALRVAALAIERPSMRTAARRLADALERENVMPDPNVRERLSATVVYAAQAPLQLSAQVQLFREISRCQFELTNSRGGLVALFGPIWVILVGLFIGWMMLALLAPLASLVSALSG